MDAHSFDVEKVDIQRKSVAPFPLPINE